MRTKRNITEILKDADKAQDVKYLIDLWNEIADNKYKFPIVEIRFANEHIRELFLRLNEYDLDFYHCLEKMYLNEV